MNEYRELAKKIHAPQALRQKVVTTAGEKKGCTVRDTGRTFLRAAVCTACALALILGTWTLRREKPPAGSGEVTLPVVEYTFALTACAAENAANGGIALLWENACGSFRIAGEGVQEVTVATDRGILTRNGETVGSTLTGSFDPETVYGLTAESGLAESLDGAVLTLTAAYSDGTAETRQYPISAERLRFFDNEDGSKALSPTLTGDEAGTVESLYTCGTESVWLTWPVAGSSTVSLSRGFGGCVRTVNGSMVTHTGIDIPGRDGMEIAAATGGTVTETGFDNSKGNYLVLDHGDGLTTLYAHCRELLAEKGQQVENGECIALMGSTGMSTGPHLHFEVRRDGMPENPIAYFDSSVRDTLWAE